MGVYMNPSRRLHIKSMDEGMNPFRTSVVDADTGESIENIYRLEITMSARDINKVNITYCVAGPNNKILHDDEFRPVLETVEIEAVEVDVFAIEDIED